MCRLVDYVASCQDDHSSVASGFRQSYLHRTYALRRDLSLTTLPDHRRAFIEHCLVVRQGKRYGTATTHDLLPLQPIVPAEMQEPGRGFVLQHAATRGNVLHKRNVHVVELINSMFRKIFILKRQQLVGITKVQNPHGTQSTRYMSIT